MDLCFVPDGDYAGYATRVLGETRGTAPGPIEDQLGRVLGTHRGILHYTVGQRRGLGVTASEPLFVLSIDAARNVLRVGPRGALGARALVTGPVNWLQGAPPAAGARAVVKVRSAHGGADASLHPLADGGVEVRFDQPQDAITPGQLCVMYDGERVMGGAPIARALEPAAIAETDLEAVAR
jgi:tRNA-specific 2-thiouridylase